MGAVRNGNIAMLRFLNTMKCPEVVAEVENIEEWLIEPAMKNGNLKVVEYLVDEDEGYNVCFDEHHLTTPHVNSAAWIINNCNFYDDRHQIVYEVNDLADAEEFVEMLGGGNNIIQYKQLFYAAGKTNFKTFEYLWNHRSENVDKIVKGLQDCFGTSSFGLSTALGAMLTLVRWFPHDDMGKGTPFLEDMSLDCVKFYLKHDDDEDEDLSTHALRDEYGVVLTGNLLVDACRRGRLEVCIYLNGHGCKAKEAALLAAVQGNHLDVIMYLHKYGDCEVGCWKVSLINAAASQGFLDIIKFLCQHHKDVCVHSTKAIDLAASNGHYHVVKFLHENGIGGCTTNAMDGAILIGRLRVVRFLHENRKEGCSENALWNAVEKRTNGATVGMLEWVVKHYGEKFDLTGFYEEVLAEDGKEAVEPCYVDWMKENSKFFVGG
ncbi:hypothetical protein HDU76_003730 [Blyttiomyces sp. JEL0837]|nr:hypothetical protein HDU76_003730 [Blyttiomyces sp. JEL0837]